MEEEKNVQVSISEKLFNALFAIVSLVLFMITKIVFHFGGGSAVFYGIMTIAIYATSFIGVLYVYGKEKKPTMEWWFNVVAFVLALAFL